MPSCSTWVLYKIDGARVGSWSQGFPQAVLNVLTTQGNALVVDFNPRTKWLKQRLDTLPGAKLIRK